MADIVPIDQQQDGVAPQTSTPLNGTQTDGLQVPSLSMTQDNTPQVFSMGDKGQAFGGDYAMRKARQYQIALHPIQTDINQIYNDVTMGNTANYDRTLSQNKEIADGQIRQQLLQQWLKQTPGGTADPQQMAVISSLTDDELFRPELGTILASRYGEQFTNRSFTAPGNVVFQKVNQEDPNAVLNVADHTQDWITRATIAQDIAEQTRKRTQGLSTEDTVADVGNRALIPGFQFGVSVLQKLMGQNGIPMTGSGMAQEIADLYTLSPEEFKKTVSERVDQLWNINATLAQEYANALISFSRADKISGNMSLVTDALIVGGAAKALTPRRGPEFDLRGMKEPPIDVPFERAPELLPAPGRTIETPGVLPGRPQAALPGQAPRALPDTSVVPVAPSTGQGITGVGSNNLPADYKPNFTLPENYKPDFTLVPDSPASEMAVAGRKIVSASMNDPRDISKIAGEIGDHKLAAQSEAVEAASRGDTTGLMSVTPETVDRRLPTDFSTSRAFEDVTDLSSASRGRLSQAALDNANNPLINQVMRVDRLTEGQTAQAVAEGWSRIEQTFNSQSHNIIDRSWVPPENDPGTNLTRSVVVFGRKDGTLFPSPTAAKNWANRNIAAGTRDFKVVQHGAGGWAVQVSTVAPEMGSIRSQEIETGLKTPDTLANRVFGSVIMPDSNLSKPQGGARARVVHSTEWMNHEIAEALSSVKALSKTERKALENVWTDNRVNHTVWRNPTDFQIAYLRRNGSMPSPKAYDAYEAMVKAEDTHLVVLNNYIITQKSARNGEFFEFGRGDNASSFDGVEIKTGLPWNVARSDPFMIQVRNPDGSTEAKVWSVTAGDKQKELIKSRLEDGASILLEPEKGTYHIIKGFKRSEVGGQQVGEAPGGRRIYKYGHYVKAPILETIRSAESSIVKYTGDFALLNAPTRKHAVQAAQSLEVARKMIIEGRPPQEITKYFQDHLEGVMPESKFRSLIQQIGPGPILATKTGQRTTSVSNWSANMPGFQDMTQSSHNVFRNITAPFMGEQTPGILDTVKTEGNTLVPGGYEPLLSPMDALSKSLGSLVDLQVTSDYRLKASNDFAQEFGHLFQDGALRVSQNPLYYMEQAKKGAGFANGLTKAETGAAKRSANAALNLAGFQDSEWAWQQALKSQMNDIVFDKLGEGFRDALAKPISTIVNPNHFLASAAFHFNFGFGNITAFLTQASELAKIAMINPKQAANSIPSMALMNWAMLTEHVPNIQNFAGLAKASLGMPVKDWIKMVEDYKNSGYHIVGHDVSFRDSLSEISTTRSWLKSAGSVLTGPFKAGEAEARMGAWQVAWREAREAKGGSSEFSRQELTRVLQRTKDLTSNMQKDSSAGWTQGVAGFVTRYWNFHAHNLEQFMGALLGSNKLTGPERLRWAAGMFAMYGIRAPLSLVGIPGVALVAWYKSQYQVDDSSGLNEAFFDGLASSFVTTLAGQKYDLTNYGPADMPFWKMIMSDKPFFERFAGAVGNKMATGLLNAAQGFGYLTQDLALSYQGKGSTQLYAGDLMYAIQDIRTVSSAQRAWQILNTQRWLNKNGSTLKNNVGLQEAMANLVAGIQPQDISRAYADIQSVADGGGQKLYSEGMAKVSGLIAQAARSWNAGDQNAGDAYKSRALAIGVSYGLLEKQWNQAYWNGFNDVPLTERANEMLQKTYQRQQSGSMLERP